MEEASIQTNEPIFGLGKIDIVIEADHAKSYSSTGLVIGPFILGIS